MSHRLVITETRSYKHTTDAPLHQRPYPWASKPRAYSHDMHNCNLRLSFSGRDPGMGILQQSSSLGASRLLQVQALGPTLSPAGKIASPRDNFSGGWLRAWSVMLGVVGLCQGRCLQASRESMSCLPWRGGGGVPRRVPRPPPANIRAVPRLGRRGLRGKPRSHPAVVETTPTTEQAFSPCLLQSGPQL